MNRTRIQIAKPDIVRHFDDLPQKTFKSSDIARILATQRDFWRIAQSTTTEEFIHFLTKNSKLHRLDFPFPYRKEIRYTWGDVPLLESLLSIKKDAYFSHYTAMRMHGLTEQIPKTIFINHEQPGHAPASKLEQHRIDAAFNRAPRVSQNAIEFGDARICLVNGMHTGQLGVIEQEVNYDSTQRIKARLTNLERTLIDITVRPIYAGGAFEVLNAFRLAKDRGSINQLAAMLQKLRYVYPYHQAIGFYLDRAGYKPSALDLLSRFPMEFDFYLFHQMGKTTYVKEWRLHVPEGL